MKRAFASLASVVMLSGLATPAFASPNFMTRNAQPRIDQRAVKSATLAAYRSRHNRGYVRARYHELVQGVVPALLVTAGRRVSTDLLKIARPGTRMIDNWIFADHCTTYSRRCSSR